MKPKGLLVSAAVIATLAASSAQAATVSGTISLPVSDGGYQPTINASKAPKVRVEGSSLVVPVTVTSQTTGTFALTGVPTGPVTLQYVETEGEDTFTLASRRVALDVSGDVGGVTFGLVHHWKNLPSYPPPWRNADYDIWEPYFVSAKIGFILFRNRGVSPQEDELWRTTNGGTGWKKIGHWTHAAGEVAPDITGRSMLFANASAGVVSAKVNVPFGMLQTVDGGTTWSVIDLPDVASANGISSVHNYARIDANRWIACGSQNTGSYMGVGSPFVVNIWETANQGATWAITRTWFEDNGYCAALDANSAGKAILFATPHAWGGQLHLELRDPSGIWTQQPGNELITNSGSGTADVPMVGDLAWVRSTQYSTLGAGLFKSTDAGATWQKLNASLPQYMDFVSAWRGFAPAGGPMYATYDGGNTWLYQSAGGGLCCHGNFIWAFDTMSAIWQDGGVGDPNGLSDIFTYVEPRLPNFELLAGTPVGNASAQPGDESVRIASYRFVNNGPMPLKVTAFKLRASGTGNDLADVSAVKTWLDRDGDGQLDAEDPQLATGVYPSDDGEITLNLGAANLLQSHVPFDVLVTYDFAGYVAGERTFTVAVDPTVVIAQTADSGTALVVAATAPTGTSLPGAIVTLEGSSVVLSGLTLNKSTAAGCLNATGTVTLSEAAPGTGVVVTLGDTLASASTPASVTVPAGATSKTFTVKTTPVAVSEAGLVTATLGAVTLNSALTVRPMGLSSVALSPNPVVGGNPVTGTATLECKAGPGDVVVLLTSSIPSAATPNAASIVVPKDMKTGAFGVTTFAVAATAKPKITGEANGIAKSKVLTVTP